ncbi:hypothetical protein GCM10022140_14630 [Rhodococcus aetherivorans]
MPAVVPELLLLGKGDAHLAAESWNAEIAVGETGYARAREVHVGSERTGESNIA